MVTVWLIAVVVAGFLLIWWEVRYWGGRITKELVEIGTLSGEQLEVIGGRKSGETGRTGNE
jgi:hypothetical protein